MKCIRPFSLAAACFLSATAFSQVVINEIHYDPSVKTELAEFIELYNRGAEPIDLGGWKFTDGLSFLFPPGTSIGAKGYLVVAENPTALSKKFPGVTALGPWSGLLANDGETIVLRNAMDQIVDQVDYQRGFPWPIVGDPPGYSIELVNPEFDNDLGGSWRPSVKGVPGSSTQILLSAGSPWKYRKGLAEASAPATRWRDPSFDDSTWDQGSAPIGYDPSLPMGTTLADMRGNYTSVFLRKKFFVNDPSSFGALTLEALYDDGFKVWINGQSVLNASLPSGEVPYNATASGSARESANYDTFNLSSPASFLVAGENTIAVQLHNISLDNSSDCFIDLRLIGETGSPNAGPTPGARNAAYDTNLPPQIRQVEHSPQQPHSAESVRVTAKITDPDGVATVRLFYQTVDPGNYIELNDSTYETAWSSIPMSDGGTAGDERALDDVYTAILPANLQTHRRLIRYRIEAADPAGRSIRAPYLDDPQPNFAYFVYDGVPAWAGAIRPGSSPVQTVSSNEMGRLPVYQLLAKRQSVEDATWNSKYTGDLYRWWGTLVYDGNVYDHIRYRSRGGVWRYAMGKNMWKFDFNRGHDFQARDNYGDKYRTQWRKLNLGANIQQGDYQHRGEQGMFESAGFRLFNLAGVEAPKTHWATLRIIDDPQEAPANNQYGGDFWGLYLAIEQEDGRFLDEHDLPDGNLYKIEGYNGELNNQGRTAATDKSDLSAFTSGYRNGTPTESWWRQHFDLNRYYSYQAIVQGIHHYDICYGKNYFYYLDPETDIWSVHTWDLDLTWADNMYDSNCGADDEFKTRVTQRTPFNLEYRNRVRELRDLLFNNDQAWKLLDEYAGIVKGANPGANILAADRAMWDYNPIMANSSIVNPSKAGQGRYYQFPIESQNDSSLRGSFDAGVQIMKNYVARRSTILDQLASDPAIPAQPTLSYQGPAGFPINRLEFRSSTFSGQAAFASMQWRVGEVRDALPGKPGIYEIQPLWETPALSGFQSDLTVPGAALKVGRTYRARVRMKDATGRWSHWSSPVQFQAGEPDNATALMRNLEISEIMYNPPDGNDFEFVELHNADATAALDLAGVTFTDGIDFTFPTGASLFPGQYALVVRAAADDNFAVFRARYSLDSSVKIFGPYNGALNNDGENLTLKTAAAGTEIISFTFKDRAEWPISPDGAGHSLVPKSRGNLNFGGNWRASFQIGGSPGAEDPQPVPGIVINEFAAHTDFADSNFPEYDSNDWIELYNLGPNAPLGDLYLSDDAGALKKWRLPSMTLNSGSLLSFDEVHDFHHPITEGFGLSKDGEELYLSFLPAGAPGRVLDAVRFGGQDRDSTWGRYPNGGDFFFPLPPSRNLPNLPPSPSLVISEIMFHPGGSNLVEESWAEYLEIHNRTALAVPLSNTNGSFRISGGIAFSFGQGSIVPAQGTVVLVSFDPAIASERNRFVTFYGLQSSNVTLLGPFSGRLGNSTDRVTLEKPAAPDLAGDPTVWVQLDEVVFTDESGADGTGESLARANLLGSGLDPSNLEPRPPTPGWVPSPAASDRDQDGLPDDWEIAHDLNPDDPSDALIDSDGDGLSNRDEYLAGTDPRDRASALRLEASAAANGVMLIFNAQPNRTYSLEYRDTFDGSPWIKLRDVSGASGPVTSTQEISNSHRYFRIVIPSLP